MDFLKKLSITKIIPMLFIGLAILGVVGFLVMKMSSAVLTPLYSDLSLDDANIIAARLTGMNVRYETGNGGQEIKVPSDKVLMLRMMFAQEGIPASGNIVGYEIFDKESSLGTSQFVYNVNLVRALEGELARTISSINHIDNVRVHIVMPKKELFSKVGAEPSASIVLKMKSNQMLSKPEIAAISNLVATAVPGLKIENITIVDNVGRPLKLGAEDQSAANLNSTATEFQQNIEHRLRQEIEELVERSVGVGKVKANVAAEIDFDREVINSEEFDPDKQVVRSKKTSESKEVESQPSNVVGVASNLPGASGASGASGSAGGRDVSRTDETTNYEISKTVTTKVIENGRVKKLSIAVLVDGTYALDEKTGKATYAPRENVELEKLKNLIISGVGLNTQRGDKIEIANMQFASDFAIIPEKESMFSYLKSDLQNIIQTVVIGIVLILVILLIIRPVILRALEKINEKDESEASGDIVASLEKEIKDSIGEPSSIGAQFEQGEMINLHSAEDRKKVNMVKNFNEIVEKHPEETVSILRNWLYQE